MSLYRLTKHRPAIAPVIALGCLCTLLAVPSAFASDASSAEARIAADHAGYAAKSASVEAVHMHLHHALNCLVGEKGEAFDATQLDPCKGKGNGAIPDAKGNAAEVEKLEAAKTKALAGVATDDLAAAQDSAKAVVDLLGK